VVSEQVARATLGEDAVFYGTQLRGASNAKAKRALAFAPPAAGVAEYRGLT
jgi:hypothetical protein